MSCFIEIAWKIRVFYDSHQICLFPQKFQNYGYQVTFHVKMPLKITNKIGKLGEDLVCEYLEDKWFLVNERNYLKKWGEIDIIASKGGRTHFIEVKSVSCENLEDIPQHDPMEKIDKNKRERLSRVIESYLLEKEMLDDDKSWQVDIAIVLVDQVEHKVKIKILKDVAL